MIAYTKGPWRVARRNIVAIEADDHMGPVAEVLARLDLPASDPAVEETREANAHLIAAAPDLLAVARMVDALALDEFPEGPDDPHTDAGCDPGTLALWRAARAAIAKATDAQVPA